MSHLTCQLHLSHQVTSPLTRPHPFPLTALPTTPHQSHSAANIALPHWANHLSRSSPQTLGKARKRPGPCSREHLGLGNRPASPPSSKAGTSCLGRVGQRVLENSSRAVPQGGWDCSGGVRGARGGDHAGAPQERLAWEGPGQDEQWHEPAWRAAVPGLTSTLPVSFLQRTYIFTFLLSSRVFMPPHDLLARVGQICLEQRQQLEAGPEKVRVWGKLVPRLLGVAPLGLGVLPELRTPPRMFPVPTAPLPGKGPKDSPASPPDQCRSP